MVSLHNRQPHDPDMCWAIIATNISDLCKLSKCHIQRQCDIEEISFSKPKNKMQKKLKRHRHTQKKNSKTLQHLWSAVTQTWPNFHSHHYSQHQSSLESSLQDRSQHLTQPVFSWWRFPRIDGRWWWNGETVKAKAQTNGIQVLSEPKSWLKNWKYQTLFWHVFFGCWDETPQKKEFESRAKVRFNLNVWAPFWNSTHWTSFLLETETFPKFKIFQNFKKIVLSPNFSRHPIQPPIFVVSPWRKFQDPRVQLTDGNTHSPNSQISKTKDSASIRKHLGI